MKLDQNFERPEKNYVTKNLDDIRIIKDKIIDIINGQGCLIKAETTVLFGPDEERSSVEIKDFHRPYEVTSHGYLYCAEAIGQLSNGEKFYIHARSPFELSKIITSILNRAQKESPDDKLEIINIRVKSDFDGHGKDQIEIKDKQRDFSRYLEKLGVTPSNIDIKNESFVGLSRERVLGYDTETEREDY